MAYVDGLQSWVTAMRELEDAALSTFSAGDEVYYLDRDCPVHGTNPCSTFPCDDGALVNPHGSGPFAVRMVEVPGARGIGESQSVESLNPAVSCYLGQDASAQPQFIHGRSWSHLTASDSVVSSSEALPRYQQ